MTDEPWAEVEHAVRVRFNRHGCQAPKRLAEAKAAGWQRMVDDIRAHPAAWCDDPRHGDDAAELAEMLQALGMRPTPRPARRSDALTARPKQRRGRGRCPVCERKYNVRIDGTLSAHDGPAGGRCDGAGRRPEEEG